MVTQQVTPLDVTNCHSLIFLVRIVHLLIRPFTPLAKVNHHVHNSAIEWTTCKQLIVVQFVCVAVWRAMVV